MRRVLSSAAALLLAAAVLLPASAAAFSSTGGCEGFRISSGTIQLAAGHWSVGPHTYSIRFAGSDVWGPFDFTVSESAPMLRGQVWLGAGLMTEGLQPVPDQMINPAQRTLFWSAWAWDMTGEHWGPPAYTMQMAKAELTSPSIEFSWDGGQWVAARQGPIVDACSNGMYLLFTDDAHANALFHRSFGPKH